MKLKKGTSNLSIKNFVYLHKAISCKPGFY